MLLFSPPPGFPRVPLLALAERLHSVYFPPLLANPLNRKRLFQSFNQKLFAVVGPLVGYLHAPPPDIATAPHADLWLGAEERDLV